MTWRLRNSRLNTRKDKPWNQKVRIELLWNGSQSTTGNDSDDLNSCEVLRFCHLNAIIMILTKQRLIKGNYFC